jgi:phosphate transport system substrate-binding protein
VTVAVRHYECMTTRTFGLWVGVVCQLVCAVGLAAAQGLSASAHGAGASVHGAGATFPAPLYAAWAADYARATGIDISYEPVGSGAGLAKIRAHEVDFGASDAPLTQPELTAADLVQFPVVIGGVVPVINITGIEPGELKLSGSVLADIYLGRIRKWNDSRIVELNPGLSLPTANITVVHRAESSGSSYLWTAFLSRSSPAWRSQMGESLAPRWPVGVGGVGNEGVASYVQRTRFAIGYVEFYFSRQHHLSDAAVRNRDGSFVKAGRDTFRAAADAANWNPEADVRQLPIDSPGPSSWPITGASFILLPKTPSNGVRAREVLRFFNWGLHEGQMSIESLEYTPIPAGLRAALPSLWGTIHDRAGKPVWP